MTGTLWLKVSLTVAAALAASVVTLLHQFRRKGNIFGQWRTAKWALSVVVVTMVVAAGVGLGLPQVVEAVQPATVAVLIASLLCAARAHGPEPAAERSIWYEIATVGVTLLVDRLEQQMYAARDSWCEARVDDRWDLDQLEDAVWYVNEAMSRRINDQNRKTRLRSDFECAGRAISSAQKANGNSREALRAKHAAQAALITMLGRAWDWGCTDIAASRPNRTSPPPGTT